MQNQQNQTGGGNAASEIKCPINGGDLGDKSPEVVAWWFQNHPDLAAKRYEGRKVIVPNDIIFKHDLHPDTGALEVLERQLDALATSERLAVPGDMNPLGVTEFRTKEEVNEIREAHGLTVEKLKQAVEIVKDGALQDGDTIDLGNVSLSAVAGDPLNSTSTDSAVVQDWDIQAEALQTDGKNSIVAADIVDILTRDGTTRLNDLANALNTEKEAIKALDGQGFHVANAGWVKLGTKEDA